MADGSDDLDVYDDDVQMGMWYEMMADSTAGTSAPPVTGGDDD